MQSRPCDMCKSDPVRPSGRKRLGMYVCGCCRGTDRFVRLERIAEFLKQVARTQQATAEFRRRQRAAVAAGEHTFS